MKVLSLHQPHATLCVVNRGDGQAVKQWEIRSWPTSYRGRLLIASTKSLATLIGPELETTLGSFTAAHRSRETGWKLHGPGLGRGIPLPLGAIIGSCEVVDCVPIRERWNADSGFPLVTTWTNYEGDKRLGLRRDVPGGYEDIHDQLPYGDFTPGRYAWLLKDAQPVEKRCPVCWGKGGGTTRIFLSENLDGRRNDCPVCKGKGTTDPIPVKGKQRLWNWEPAA